MPIAITPVQTFPKLLANQGDTRTKYNQLIALIDAAAFGVTIINQTTTIPPVSPSDGDIYIPAATATGVWAGHEGHIAVFDEDSNVWLFVIPRGGMRMEDAGDTNSRWYYQDSSNTWISELAIASEIDTGTDATKAITSAALAGSQLNKSRDRVYGVLQTEGTGTPTLEANSLGLASVSRSALGLYAYTFSGGLGLTANAYTAMLGQNISTSANFFVAKILTRTSAAVTFEVRNASTLTLADGGDWPLTIKANIA